MRCGSTNDVLPVLEVYRQTNNRHMAAAYIRLNRIVRLEVCRCGHGPGFELWEMTGVSVGFPHMFRLRRRAIEVAKQLAAFTALPLVIT